MHCFSSPSGPRIFRALCPPSQREGVKKFSFSSPPWLGGGKGVVVSLKERPPRVPPLTITKGDSRGSLMTQVFNRQSEKDTRRSLRKSLQAAELILWSKVKNRR